MVLLALRRAINTASSSSLDWLILEELERLSGQYVYRHKQHQQKHKKKGDDGSVAAYIHSYSRKRKLKEEQWTIQRDEEHDTIKIIHDNASSNDDEEQQTTNQLIDKLQIIRTLLTQTIPQISSRIIHATSPILQDLSRGYFVPFLTVALACLARIHCLVLRFGREVVGVACQCVPRLRECVIAGEEENDDGGEKLKEALSPFKVNTMNTTTIEQGSSEAPSNEWNELMKPFTEINHDEFTKKVNNFVTERRWKDAMVAFGIKEEDWNKVQQLSEEQLLADVQENEDKDGNGNDGMDDMGELVHMQHENNNEKDGATKRSNAGIDDNMARVLDKKRRIDDEVTSASSAKKKKRRRKKKKSSDDAEVVKDAVDAVKKSSDEGDIAESAGNIKKAAVEGTKTASNQSDEGKESSTVASPKEPVNLEDEVMLDTKESEAIEPVQKKEKKSKKKKTKKKKSKNVIDDIFG